jgi:hypothetical protein
MANKTTEPGGLRITNQYRSRRGMMYELECNGNNLDVHVTARENAGDPADWRVDARLGHAEDAATITEWGDTRAAALERVGRSWAEQCWARSLPSFDWEHVAKALTLVRAL